ADFRSLVGGHPELADRSLEILDIAALLIQYLHTEATASPQSWHSRWRNRQNGCFGIACIHPLDLAQDLRCRTCTIFPRLQLYEESRTIRFERAVEEVDAIDGRNVVDFGEGLHECGFHLFQYFRCSGSRRSFGEGDPRHKYTVVFRWDKPSRFGRKQPVRTHIEAHQDDDNDWCPFDGGSHAERVALGDPVKPVVEPIEHFIHTG